jgi:hypothetical protein
MILNAKRGRKMIRAGGVGGKNLLRVANRCENRQELLRHAKVQTTLDLYLQSMPAERMVAQGAMLSAIFGQSLP